MPVTIPIGVFHLIVTLILSGRPTENRIDRLSDIINHEHDAFYMKAKIEAYQDVDGYWWAEVVNIHRASLYLTDFHKLKKQAVAEARSWIRRNKKQCS